MGERNAGMGTDSLEGRKKTKWTCNSLVSANVRNGERGGRGIMYFVLAFNMSFVVSVHRIFSSYRS